MTPRLKGYAAAVALLLSCTPTEPCACPPARTSLIVYGVVRTAAGEPAAAATIHYMLALPPGDLTGRPQCEFDGPFNEADPDQARTDADGRFRSVVYSGFPPSTRCLRVIADRPGTGTERDSAQVDGLLVPFKDPPPDSIGLFLTLR